ncbi:MAG: hypothetical protein EOO38_06135, partial [Cytophagaceae bacterium]
MKEGMVTNINEVPNAGVATVAAEKPGAYDYRIPIRMTREERAVIGKKAQDNNLSVSRYLVTVATCETDIRPEDQARLLRLKSYFDDAATRLQNLTILPLFRAQDEGATPVCGVLPAGNANDKAGHHH